MVLDLRKLQQRLEKAEPANLYLLVGDEDFLVGEALRLLKARCVEESLLDFNCDVFDVGETAAGTVCDAAEMLPMLSPRRFVAYRGVDALKDKDWDALSPLLDNPVPSTTFVMTCESLDKRKKHYKKLADVAVIVELKRPYENQVADWIDYLAFKMNLQIDRDAARLLKQFVGVNLTELHNELIKLREYLGERTKVGAPDVLEVVSQTRVDRIFDLTDAIGKRDKVMALHSLANLLDHGQSEVGVVAMIARHFRILAQLKEAQRDGLTGQRLATQAGVPPFLLPQYLEQIRHWDAPKIERTFLVLRDTDRALKSSTVPAHVWLENFVLKTCS